MVSMTDQEIADSPEVKTIRKHLRAAARAMEQLQKKSGRTCLKIFVEAESGPCLLDGDRDAQVMQHGGNMGDRQVPLADGGPYLSLELPITTAWACGAW